MLDLPRKLFVLLTINERWRLLGLGLMAVVMGFAQVVGVGSIAPFVSVLINPESVETNRWLRSAFDTFGFESTESFLVFLALLVLAALILANGLLALVQWMLIRFAWSLQVRISLHLLGVYLRQPYTEFLSRNSADKGKNVIAEVSTLTNGIMIPLLRMTAFTVSGVAVFAALFWVNPAITMAIVAVLGAGYAGIYMLIRHRLSDSGQRRMEANSERFKAVNEAFGSIKEIKVLGREESLIERYGDPARQLARATVTQQVLAQIPGYGMQVLGVGTLLVVTIILMGDTSRPLAETASLLAIYAFGAQRLMPALQQIYLGASLLKFNKVVVDTLYHDIVEEGFEHSTFVDQPAALAKERLPFEHAIRLENVTFKYPGAATPSSDSITIEIPRRSFVAFVGATGAGKTTLADIVLGLLRPQHGNLLVDGTVVDDTNMRAWQNNLGYVPQDVYLADDSIAANIAFGIPAAERDQSAIERSAIVANVHGFITAELPDGYDTIVGERGVRLSGGQRQRIGIARALYHEPEVLVLDEATSNLDQSTEAAVHQAIERVAATKTVIMIAHRLTTTQNCDTLFLMSHGQVIARGSYDELIAESDRFRAMVGMTHVDDAPDGHR